MSICPAGHTSAADDYCDVCGRPIPAGVPVSGPPVEVVRCAGCQAVLSGRFCEHCGRDSAASADPPAGTASADPLAGTASAGATARPAATAPGAGTWFVAAVADRAYFEAVTAMDGPDAASVRFPHDCQERRFPLDGDQILIGRRLAGTGIDLGDVVEDAGVSHRHARLLAQPGGSWAVEDLGSTNGTRVNSHTAVLEPFTRVPLGVGDRLYVGAWTRLTLHTSEYSSW